MRLKSLGPHCHEVSDGRRAVLFSYATPVAFHEAGVGYSRTDTQHSVTTSRHINAWLDGAKPATVPQATLDALCLGGLSREPAGA